MKGIIRLQLMEESEAFLDIKRFLKSAIGIEVTELLRFASAKNVFQLQFTEKSPKHSFRNTNQNALKLITKTKILRITVLKTSSGAIVNTISTTVPAFNAQQSKNISQFTNLI